MQPFQNFRPSVKFKINAFLLVRGDTHFHRYLLFQKVAVHISGKIEGVIKPHSTGYFDEGK
jgi:hypothetical protein